MRDGEAPCWYKNTRELHDLYEQILHFLKTDGSNWVRPSTGVGSSLPVHPIGVQPLTPSESEHACQQIITYRAPELYSCPRALLMSQNSTHVPELYSCPRTLLMSQNCTHVPELYSCPRAVLMSQNSTHVPELYSCPRALLMSQNSTHVPELYSCPRTLLMSQSSTHVPELYSCPRTLLMSQNSTHVPELYSCPRALLMSQSSTHVPELYSCPRAVLMSQNSTSCPGAVLMSRSCTHVPELYSCPRALLMSQNSTHVPDVYSRTARRPKMLVVPIPYLDDPLHPRALAVPLRHSHLLSLMSEQSVHVLSHYYLEAVRCLAGQPNSAGQLAGFHENLNNWLHKFVLPRLEDDLWYPGFGGALQILETLKRSGVEIRGRWGAEPLEDPILPPPEPEPWSPVEEEESGLRFGKVELAKTHSMFLPGTTSTTSQTSTTSHLIFTLNEVLLSRLVVNTYLSTLSGDL
uniref:Uncharacterized protein n=1 Tax=Timema poppense TaxID=170557 RepID=A0A7R9DV94_TIMPO|nr:unnamed protein product [Timema poppensis]